MSMAGAAWLDVETREPAAKKRFFASTHNRRRVSTLLDGDG
jgi:hypothetical protein